MDTGPVPAEKGEPGRTSVRLPSAATQFISQILKAETLFEPALARYRNSPALLGVTAIVTAEGAVPTGVRTGLLSAPDVGSTEYSVTVASTWLATYRNLASGVTATATGP